MQPRLTPSVPIHTFQSSPGMKAWCNGFIPPGSIVTVMPRPSGLTLSTRFREVHCLRNHKLYINSSGNVTNFLLLPQESFC